jgi:thiol-disulfide isomerase/thioredoxin
MRSLNFCVIAALFVLSIGCKNKTESETTNTLTGVNSPEPSTPDPSPSSVTANVSDKEAAPATENVTRASVSDSASSPESDTSLPRERREFDTTNTSLPRERREFNSATVSDVATITDESFNTTIYEQTQMPSENETANWDAEQWVKQIASVDKAFQILMVDLQGNHISREKFSSEARRLGMIKLQSSEAMLAQAKRPIEAELAVVGKMEALSQLAGLGDRLRATELLQFAQANSSFESAKVARQAAVVLLGFSLNALSGGSDQPDVLLQQVDVVLKDKRDLRMPEFKMMDQVIRVLDQKGLTAAASQVRSKTIEAFKQNADPEIAFTVWQMEMADNSDFQKLLADLRANVPDPAVVNRSLQTYLTNNKSDWSLYFLANEIKTIEFNGHHIVASLLADAIEQNETTFASTSIHDLAMFELTELADANGKAFSIGDLKGKVILVTFWASWCNVCRSEFPTLKELYASNNEKGFEIVGVNLDDSDSAMNSIVQVAQLPWLNVRSNNPNATGINSTAAQQIPLRATPFSILIDRDGKVLGTQLHGDALKAKIAEALANL